jgi:hypothetical protein
MKKHVNQQLIIDEIMSSPSLVKGGNLVASIYEDPLSPHASASLSTLDSPISYAQKLEEIGETSRNDMLLSKETIPTSKFEWENF